MADQRLKKMPRAIRISRKLPLSSEELRVMASPDPTDENAIACTLKRTGCGPAHTC